MPLTRSSATPPSIAPLENRGLLRLSGEDATVFLQGVVSTDVRKVSAHRAVFGALLTPQGKYLFDFFVFALNGDFYLDGEKARLADLKKRLTLYKLRAKVTIEEAEAFRVHAFFGEGALAKLGLPEEEGAAKPFEGGLLYADPRLAAAGARAALPVHATPKAAGFSVSDFATYDRFRMSLGLPDGSRDLAPEKSTLLEYGFDELNGIDWRKGCYIGQEVTARMKHRGLVRKRLLPVTFAGDPPPAGTPVLHEGREVGVLCSTAEGMGLALLQLAAVEDAGGGNAPLLAGATRLTPHRPSWMRA